MFLYNRVRGITEGLGPKQLKYVYNIDAAIRVNAEGMMADKVKFNAIAAETKADWLIKAEGKWGAAMADKIDKAHGSLRRLMNALQYDLAGEGLLERYRFKPAYWPLLEVEAHPLTDMFPLYRRMSQLSFSISGKIYSTTQRLMYSNFSMPT